MSLKDRVNEISKVGNAVIYPPFPQKNLLIEVTNCCNLDCIFCANNKSTRKRGFINSELAKKVLKDAYSLGTREVGFYTTGEPLLNLNLSEYIRYAKDLGYTYTYITTNGVLMNDEKIKELVSSGIDSIKFSINAINKEDYKMIHGRDLFGEVISNLKKLYNYRESNNLYFKIYVSYIMTKYTSYETKAIKDFFGNYSDGVVVNNVRNQSGLCPFISRELICEDEKDLVTGKRNIPCHYVFDTVNVSYEGYLSACCTDFQNYLVYADLNKESLSDAWHNIYITNLRNMHLKKEIDNTLCHNCIYSDTFIPQPILDDKAWFFDYNIFNDTKKLERIKR